MARLYHVSAGSPPPAGFPPITIAYTVTRAVGIGCPNQREDVMLVQHLLRVAWNDGGGSKGFKPPGEAQALTADGAYGPRTQKFIDHFQKEAKARGANVKQDGRVDPVGVTGGPTGSISGTFYTILALNSARNSRQSNQADIKADPGFPAMLEPYFYINW
jgi:hypothetical protein